MLNWKKGQQLNERGKILTASAAAAAAAAALLRPKAAAALPLLRLLPLLLQSRSAPSPGSEASPARRSAARSCPSAPSPRNPCRTRGTTRAPRWRSSRRARQLRARERPRRGTPCGRSTLACSARPQQTAAPRRRAWRRSSRRASRARTGRSGPGPMRGECAGSREGKSTRGLAFRGSLPTAKRRSGARVRAS